SVTAYTCVPADPASKGGTEPSAMIAKADLVPKDTNRLPEYGSFAKLEAACLELCQKINTRPHRITKRPPSRCSPRSACVCTRSRPRCTPRVRHHPAGAGQYADGDV